MPTAMREEESVARRAGVDARGHHRSDRAVEAISFRDQREGEAGNAPETPHAAAEVHAHAGDSREQAVRVVEERSRCVLSPRFYDRVPTALVLRDPARRAAKRVRCSCGVERRRAWHGAKDARRRERSRALRVVCTIRRRCVRRTKVARRRAAEQHYKEARNATHAESIPRTRNQTPSSSLRIPSRSNASGESVMTFACGLKPGSSPNSPSVTLSIW